MKWKPLLLLIPMAAVTACSSPPPREADARAMSFTVRNPLDIARDDAVLRLTARELQSAFPDTDWSQVYFQAAEEPVPFQANDLDQDGTADEYLLLLNLGPQAEREVRILPLKGQAMPNFTKRTHAEISHKVNGQWEGREYRGGEFKNVDSLRVPPEHTDHSWYIRYEGPGWESDKVGYRFYLDWRNATDIFGKKTTDMVLQQVGQDGFDSYHEPGTWGMDILKVGESLGIGALGAWVEDHAERVAETDSLSCAIAQNGSLQSLVRTHYYGWRVGDATTDLTSELSIQAGSRLTRHDIQMSEPFANLCTGIVKHEGAPLFTKTEGEWGYLATWGVQSLAEDQLGMAVLFRTADSRAITEDTHSHVVVLTPNGNKLTYYFLAAWEQEPGGITSETAFRAYLDQTVRELAQPVTVQF